MKKIILSIALLSIWSCTEATKKQTVNGSPFLTAVHWTVGGLTVSHMPPGWKIVDSVLTFTTAQILEEI